MIGTILPIISALLANLPGTIGNFFKARNELDQLKLQTAKEIELAKHKAAEEMARLEIERSNSALQATGRWFKYFTFFMWFGPFMLGVIFPGISKTVFANLALMPEWYVQSCIAIMFTVWGIAVGGPVVASIFSAVGRYFEANRQFKVDLAGVQKKSFYDALRSIKGVISPEEVKTFEKVFEELGKK